MRLRKRTIVGVLIAALLMLIVLGGIRQLNKPTVMAFPAHPGKLFEPGPTFVGKPNEHKVVTMVRPIGTGLSAGDPVMLAVHWQAAVGSFVSIDLAGKTFLRAETVDSLRFTITAPESQPVTLRSQEVAHLKRWVGPSGGWRLERMPTLLLSLTEEGLSESLLWDPPEVMPIPWKTKAVGLFSRPGEYEVAVKGTICLSPGPAIPFTTEPIKVRIGVPGLKSRQEIEQAAWSSLRATFPETIALGDNAHPLNRTLIAQNSAGNYLVKFACHGAVVPGHRDYRVEVRPDGKVITIYYRDVFTCIASGTLVETENGPVPVEHIVLGDHVWGWDAQRKAKMLGKVIHLRESVVHETIAVGGTLRATAQHPIFTTKGWKQAGDLSGDDLLLTSDLKEIKAGIVTHVSEAIPVFDLTVEGPANFFAGGILVHNKILVPAPTYIEDPWITLWPQYPFNDMGTYPTTR
jgi:hypothetical protein